MTGCTAPRDGVHDYSQPPHNTPDRPRVSTYAPGDCQSQHADQGRCEHERRYEIVVYSPGTHDWIRMWACIPCTASLRVRHEHLGPGGTNGIYGIRDLELAGDQR